MTVGGAGGGARTGSRAGGLLGLANPRAWGSTFAALSERDFAWYFAGNLAFFMGMQMQMILRGFLAFELTNTAAALGLMSASIAIPMLLVAPFGGVVADRVNKRTLLIVSQTGSAIVSVMMALLILTGLVEFWHLIAMSVATGIIFSFNMPARQALVPQLVPQHKLMNAISLQMGGMNLTRILAPALGGVLIVPIGVGWVYMLTAVLFVVAVLSEFHLPIHGMTVMRKPAAFREDFAEGFRYIREQRLIALLLGIGLVFPLFAFPLQMMLPVFASDVFGKGGAGLGILAAATGVGGLIGAMIAANLDGYSRKGRLMLVGGLWMGALFVAFTQMQQFVPALIFLALGNVGGMIFQTTNNTVIQANLPAHIRGRVMAVMMMSFGLMPLGVLPVSFAADAFGAQTAVAFSSVMLILAMLGFFLFSRRLRTLRLDQFAEADLSPVQAATMVAKGELSAEEAERRTKGVAGGPPGSPRTEPPPPLAPLPAEAAEPAAVSAAEPAAAATAEPVAVSVAEPTVASVAEPVDRTLAAPVPALRRAARPALFGSAIGAGLVLGFAASGSGEIVRALRTWVAARLDPDR